MRRAIPPAALAAAAVAAGCGDSEGAPTPEPTRAPGVAGAQRSVLETVDALQAAARAGDGERVCSELFTAQLARSVRTSAGRACAAEVRGRLFAPDTELSVRRDIRVEGDRASATVAERDGAMSTLVLRRVDGRWRIDSVTPAG
jgi:hypothetical protein